MKCFNVHITQVPPPDQNNKYLSMASYIKCRKSLFVTRTQPVQQFPATPISTTIITAIFSPNHPILQSGRTEQPTHPSESVRNKRRTICWATLASSIKPSYVHIFLVGHLLKREGSMEVSRSSPVLQAGTHGQARRTTQTMCHAENTLHSLKLSILIGHPTSTPIQRCLLHHGTCTP
jgi:hypothetical protein